MIIDFIHLFILAHLLTQVLTLQAKVPAIIVFGDSSVDSGNNNQIWTILKSNFEPYGRDFIGGKPTGRFSNGRIVTDIISEAFGVKPTIPAYLDPTYNISDFSTGVCFASAGTGYDNATSDVLVSSRNATQNFTILPNKFHKFSEVQSVMPLWKELEYYKEYQKKLRGYLGIVKANDVLAEALYLISVGANDFLENYYLLPGRSLEFSIEEYQEFLAVIAQNFVRDLYQLGARKISLGGVPPLGCLPLERTTNIFLGSACVEEYNSVARDFNEKLKELVIQMNKELTGIQLVLSNPYDIFSAIIYHPNDFGFDTAAKACCGTGYLEMGYMCDKLNPFTCSNANKHVFWDSFHPTEKTNRIAAEHLVKTSLAKFL